MNRLPKSEAVPCMSLSCDRYVFQNRQSRKNARDLKRSRNAGHCARVDRLRRDAVPGVDDFAGIRTKRSCQQIDEGRFSRTIRADHRDQFSFGQIEVDIVDGVQPTETLRDLYGPKY